MPALKRWLLWSAFTIFSYSLAEAATEERDSVVTLQDLEVNAKANSRTIDSKGNVHLSSRNMDAEIRVLGETDFVNTLKRLPGVSTTGDYGSGININGNTASQSYYTIDGTPVYFPYRFGGVFSTFNTPHFRSADFERSAHTEAYPSRLGASLTMHPYKRADRLAGEINVGLLSSSLGLRFPAGKKFGIAVAGRVSYINQIYNKLIKTDDSEISYDFEDLNITAHYQPTDNDRLELNLFGNNDLLNCNDDNLGLRIDVRWRNALAGLTWHHTGETNMSARLFWSGYFATMNLGMTDVAIKGSSDINSFGGAYNITAPLKHNPDITLRGGAELTAYLIKPQRTDIAWIQENTDSPKIFQRGCETRLYGGLNWQANDRISLDAGVSLSYWHTEKSYNHFMADPRITFYYKTPEAGTFNIHAGGYTQYLHQTGFSEIGLASNFWFCSDSHLRPQHSWNISMGWNGRPIKILPMVSAEIYYTWVDSQSEFDSTILDLTENGYNPLEHILQPYGFNTGVNLELSDSYGPVDASVSYSWGMGKRRNSGQSAWWNALSSQGNKVSVTALYHAGSHWDLNAVFSYAQGRVYTPINAIYAIGANVALEYGLRNSSRLPDYHRLDIGATYKLQTGGRIPLRHLVNISMINVYGRKNVESQTISFIKGTNPIYFRQFFSLYRFLPSISYTLIFQ